VSTRGVHKRPRDGTSDGAHRLGPPEGVFKSVTQRRSPRKGSPEVVPIGGLPDGFPQKGFLFGIPHRGTHMGPSNGPREVVLQWVSPRGGAHNRVLPGVPNWSFPRSFQLRVSRREVTQRRSQREGPAYVVHQRVPTSGSQGVPQKGFPRCFPYMVPLRSPLIPWRQNPKIRHRIHMRPPTIPIMSQVNPVHSPSNQSP
jgi:hypothetical protein